MTSHKGLDMPEYIPIRFLRSAAMLAEELNYSRAAKKLELSARELREVVSTLENRLCFRIFLSRRGNVELTKEGTVFLRVFARFLRYGYRSNAQARRPRNEETAPATQALAKPESQAR
jgi:DNA-binding transcriptional LysR family regulator